MLLHAQSPSGEWRAVSAGAFRLKVPTAWREMTMRGGGPALIFTGGGDDGLPIMYEDRPLIVTIFVDDLDVGSLEECRTSIVRGYAQNPDRVFESDPVHREVAMVLPSGDSAYSIATRFFRTSKGLYQNRYDLAVFSASAKRGYMVTVSIQHDDRTYGIEKDIRLREYVERLFATVDVD